MSTDTTPTATEQLAALEQSARDGATVTPEALALARAHADAEADLARLAKIGAAERAKAEKAAGERRAGAKAAVQGNPPVLPEGMAAATERATAAIDDVVALVRDYARQIDQARTTLQDGGVSPNVYGTDQTDDPAFDHEFHGGEYLRYVVIDGETVGISDAAPYLQKIVEHAKRALRVAAT
ncbi:hypothetical protein ACFTSD_17575 [Nocardiaceae bacterium NPDC056970]